MADSTCSIDGCDEPPSARGWCKKHYYAWHRYGDPLAPTRTYSSRLPSTGATECSEDDCDKPPYTNAGLCQMHYKRLQRTGTLQKRTPTNAGQDCKIPGCPEPASTQGLCITHYSRLRTHGDPLANVRTLHAIDYTQRKTCPECDAEFAPKAGASQAQWDARVFCSRTCRNARNARTNNPMRDDPNVQARHGAKVKAGMDASPYYQDLRIERAKRETKKTRKRERKRAIAQAQLAQRTQRTQLTLFATECVDHCGAYVAREERRCEECSRRRRRGMKKRWNRAHPDYVRLAKRVRASRRRRAPGRTTQAQAAARYAYYGGCCAYCLMPLGPLNERPRTWHWDHVIPLASGGSNWPANLRPACAHCNNTKNAKHLEDFMTDRMVVVQCTGG